jgi:ribonucleoside-diphosphate reductase alpha chain
MIDKSRNDLLTPFGKATLDDRYLLKGESYQDMFWRVANAFADDENHAQRLYDYMSKHWFMPATPVLSNGGTDRGLPISCFLNQVDDNLRGILDTYNENFWLSARGGGIGTYWGGVRSIGEPVGSNGHTSGIIPFIRVMDSLSLAISQGSLRRGSAAVYIDIHHPEIEEFLEIRKASGDFNRKSVNLHHGVNITDAFMVAVKNDEDFPLVSPKTGETIKTVSARGLWAKILELRISTGEPYLLFVDTCNAALPQAQKDKGLKVQQSNLCSEITLPTNNDRTAVCCLSSLNALYYTEWKDDDQFFEDIFRFLDNVLQSFIENAPPEMARAVYSATQERAIGLGLMGFHSFLQKIGTPFEGAMAKSWNKNMFKTMREQADRVSQKLADELGSCPDVPGERFSHKLAVAPTASISIICGGVSAGIEPIPANIYTHKTLSGSFTVKNPALDRLLHKKAMEMFGDDLTAIEWVSDRWTEILESEGSVAGLECFDDYEKAVFRTSFEIDQRWIIEHAEDRAPLICQAQSVNVFLPADINKYDLLALHWSAWEKGLKSLYYCRSKSIQRTSVAGKFDAPEPLDYDECLSCQ